MKSGSGWRRKRSSGTGLQVFCGLSKTEELAKREAIRPWLDPNRGPYGTRKKIFRFHATRVWEAHTFLIKGMLCTRSAKLPGDGQSIVEGVGSTKVIVLTAAGVGAVCRKG